MFLEHSILKWFLKVLMTLNTEVMAAEDSTSTSPSQNKVIFKYIYINRKGYFKLYSYFTILLSTLYFDKIIAALVSIRDFFQKHLKNLTNSNLFNVGVHINQSVIVNKPTYWQLLTIINIGHFIKRQKWWLKQNGVELTLISVYF